MLKKIRRLQARLGVFFRRIVLPGFEGENLYDVGTFFWKGFTTASVGTRSAAVTYRFLIAMFPLIVGIFSLIPFVPIENFQDDILLYIQDFFPPQVYAFFHEPLEDLILRKRTLLLSIGFVVTLYFASAGINALLEAFSASYHLEVKRKFYKQQLWSLGLLFFFLLLSILLTLISSLGQMLIDSLSESEIFGGKFNWFIMTSFKNLLLIGLYYAAITTLYNIGHTEKTKWKFFSVGATAAALGILLMQKGFSFYLTYVAKFDKLYGPLGAAIGFLLFFYYLFYILIIGFELNVAIHHAKKTRIKKDLISSNTD